MPIKNTLRQPPYCDYSTHSIIDHTSHFSIGNKNVFTLNSRLITVANQTFIWGYIGRGKSPLGLYQWKKIDQT